MKSIIALVLLICVSESPIRIFDYQGQKVPTTFEVDASFIGEYAGKKSGYLRLNSDGSGVYKYDIFGFASANCKSGEIEMEWGFLVDENEQVVSFEREYGRSYPILMRSTGSASFQGCREPVMLDFIMLYEDGTMGVSSSDDWIKD